MGTTPLTGEASCNISAIIHTRNSQDTLDKALQSLLWADERLVIDMASTDDTLEIARRFPVRIIGIPPHPRVDGVRNSYLNEAKNEWIFVLDSDESLAADAPDALQRLIKHQGDRFDAFALPRYNTIAGQIMPGGPWYPDHQIRLFRKGTVRWTDNTHVLPEVLTGPHRLCELKPPECPHIHHQNYSSLEDFIRRQLDYAIRDCYDDNPENFNFSDAVARAYEILAFAGEKQNGGDLTHALTLVMAWDALIRGLIQWERLDRKPSLGFLAALPIAVDRMPWWRIALRRWLWRRHSLRFALRHVRYILQTRIRRFGWHQN